MVPAANLTDTTTTVNLFDGELTEAGVALTPAQLGKYTAGAVIKITYTGAGEEDTAGVGICGNGAEWYTGTNNLASVGAEIENTYVTTYADFVEFAGITSPVNTYVFQNWGLTECSTTTIQLVIPIEGVEIA